MESTGTVRRLRGKVVRWGMRGYGFISCADLPREAWCHVKFIVDRDIDTLEPLPNGMELEFVPREVEGGKIQAIEVTRPGIAPPSISSPAAALRSTIRGLDRLRAVTVVPVIAAPPAVELPTAQPAMPEIVVDRGLAARVGAERDRLDAERGRLGEEATRLVGLADAAEADVPTVEREFEERMAALQRERDQRIADLRGRAEERRREAEAVRARRDSLPSVSAKSLGILAEDLGRARSDLGTWRRRQEQGREGLLRARLAAVVAVGEEAVCEYEEVRRRLAVAADGVERKAYASMEKAGRAQVAGFAEALDGERASEPARLGIVVLAPDDPDGRLVLVAPVAAADDDRDDISWRIRAFLFDTAERAAREMDATVTVGATCGCLAVDLRPWGTDPELVEIAVQEAWDTRPSLAAAPLTLVRELVPGIDPQFFPVESNGEDDERTAPGPAVGGDLRAVGRRLGLPLADLVASLGASGLPFPDDRIDADVESSLRVLLGIAGVEEPGSAAEPVTRPSAPPLDPASPQVIAREILAKLLRDGRVGGRHTAEDNVWGHAFRDDEKAVARELTRRLIRRGILMSKPKPGGIHVSIDPRHIRDVHRIIGLGFPDSSLFEGL